MQPTQIKKDLNQDLLTNYEEQKLENNSQVAEENIKSLSKEAKDKMIKDLNKQMTEAAKALDFIEAARLRDLIKSLKTH